MERYGLWILKSLLLVGFLFSHAQQSYGLSVNDRVSVVNGPKNVRSTPDSSTSANILGEKSTGALGTIIGGPTTATGYTWYNVNFDSNPDGWIISSGLALAALPSPSISSVSPNPMPGTSANQAFTINGADFQNGCTLTFTDTSGSTFGSVSSKLTYNSSSRLTYQLNNANDAGTWRVRVNNPDGKSSSSYSFTVTPAPTVTYTVSYNANSATSGTAPTSQTKTNGVALTLRSNTGNLVRTGYTFAGWNTLANGSGTTYAVSASYTINANVTLYAKWTASGSGTVMIPGKIPYTRQNGDTPDAFNGAGACGAASAVMITAYSGRLDPHPITVLKFTALPNHPRNFGWYIAPYNGSTPISYSAYGYTYTNFTRDTELSGNASAYGAYGYIHNPSGYASARYARNYFWKHGLYAEYVSLESSSQTAAEGILRAEIDKGRPVWISTRLLDTPTSAVGHIVVIQGYDSTGFFCADPMYLGSSANDGSNVRYTWYDLYQKVNPNALGKWIVKTAIINNGDSVKVTNVGSTGLRVRVSPSETASEVPGCSPRSLNDTGVVIVDTNLSSCFWNDSKFTWVKVRWANGEGWSAIGDPDSTAVTSIWLTKVAAASASLSISPTSRDHSSTAASGQTFGVTANVSWTAAKTASWITINAGATGSNNGTVTYSVSANSGSARSGTITVSGGGITRTFTVNQAAANASLSISPTSRDHSSAAASGQTIGVTANVSWTATKTASWITITAGATASNNGTVTYSVSANSGSARSGTITVSGGGITRTFTVNQAAASSYLDGALDCPTLILTTGGNANWFGQTAVTHDGVDAAKSGVITHNEQSWMQTTVTGPGTITFWSKVSSEADWDFLRFEIGAVQQLSISGESDWMPRSYSVPAGTQILKWVYIKDASADEGSDCAWVDQVQWTPQSAFVPNDFDGDGRSDLGCYRPAGGQWALLYSGGGSRTTSFGYSGTIPITGDFDGDGIVDFGCYYAPGGYWYLMQSRAGFKTFNFGYTGTVPVVGDFDGDGKADIGCYYAPGGNWYVMQSRAGFKTFNFGYTGTVPVVGDFDGDGKADIGCYYAPGGNWYLMQSRAGFKTDSFGYRGTVPVVGDYDGDGKSDYGYYDPAGTWYLKQSRSGVRQQQFGGAGYVPLGK